MAFQRAGRMAGIEISEIVQISERAAALRAEGRDIISFGTGEPDVPTPDHVIEAAHEAARAGQTGYPPTGGRADLKAAIAAQAGRSATEVLASTGAKQVIANAMLATLNPGDEVILPAPYWTSYSDIVALAEGRPLTVPCPAELGFKLTPEALEAAITPRTRWLFLNSPSNPTGAVYSRAEQAALAEVLARHPHVWVLSDEIYEHLSYVPFTSFTEAAPALAARVLIVNGASKAWSMTGWRIGWGIGPAPLIKAMTAVQGQLTSGASSISQCAALAAVTGPAALLAERRENFRARRDMVIALLDAVPGLSCARPDGAFYLFPKLDPGLLARFGSDAEFCHWLLEAAGVATVPGRAFAMPGHLRLSFAYAEAQLRAGLARMADALAEMPSEEA